MAENADTGESRGPEIAAQISMPQRRDRGEAIGTEQTRTTRQQDLHVNDPMHGFDDIDYSVRPDNLRAPEPNPGMAQRWIASKVMGEAVPLTYGRQMRQGWRPRPANTVVGFQELHMDDKSVEGGVICYEGLILCERPVQVSKKFRQAIRAETSAQTEGVQSAIRETAERGGIPIRTVAKSQNTRGRRSVQAATDMDDDL